MRYDDRLATVLRLIPVGPNVARIQYRQLLDLLGTCPPQTRSEMLDQAYLRLAEISAQLPAQDRAGMLAQAGIRLRAPRLISALAQAEPQVASAAIHAAALTEDEWLDLIPALPIFARGRLGSRRDLPPPVRALLARLGLGDAALPASEATGPAGEAEAPAREAAIPVADAALAAGEAGLPTVPESPVRAVPPPSALPARSHGEGIGAIVQRIEAFRRAREAQAPADSPPLPLEDTGDTAPVSPVQAFDFASDSEGRIAWCEADVAPMVVGHLLGAGGGLYKAIRNHQPLRAARVVLEGAPAIAGEWQVDAVPRFDPMGGRFIGHMGRFRRPAPGEPTISSVPRGDSESDRLRQLLHELRTPVNAIQGFAEIIQQQLFGPVPHEYRAIAAAVAADSARMLAGFEELERYAKLDSGAMDMAAGESDLSAVALATIARLAPHTTPRESRFALTTPPTTLPVALAPLETERLCWRLLATLAGHMGPGEHLPLALGQDGRAQVLEVALPRRLATLSDPELFHANALPEGPTVGMFGSGLALRLASAEARAAGGALIRHQATLHLRLPGLTARVHGNSQCLQDGSIQFAAPAA